MICSIRFMSEAVHLHWLIRITSWVDGTLHSSSTILAASKKQQTPMQDKCLGFTWKANESFLLKMFPFAISKHTVMMSPQWTKSSRAVALAHILHPVTLSFACSDLFHLFFLNVEHFNHLHFNSGNKHAGSKGRLLAVGYSAFETYKFHHSIIPPKIN